MEQSPKNSSPIGASGVSSLIILSLACLSTIYRLFSINIDFINPIIGMIDDASTFLSFICLSFFICNFVKATPKKMENIFEWDNILHIANIVLLNRLYSNKKLLSVYQSIIGLNRYYIAFIIASLLISFVLFPKIVKKIQEGKSRKLHSGKPPKEEPTVSSTSGTQNPPASDENNDDTNRKNVVSDVSDDDAVKPRHYIFAVTLSAIVALIVFCLVDYWIVTKDVLNVDRPAFLSLWPNLGYIGIVGGSAIVVAFIAFTTCIYTVRKYRYGFNWTALWAVALEIFVIYAANRADISDWSDTLFSYLTNDIFSFVIYGILLFMVFQIGFIVFFDLFKPTGNKNKITQTLEIKIQEIENTIVELACGLLSGCLDLFQFIPSFFETIGVLLLDNPPRKPNDQPADNDVKTTPKKNENENV